jgi:UTP--glucose-1-phosphate uridylyltransferase
LGVVVVPVGGLGTRLLPATKEQPKEMLPVFSAAQGGSVCLKPLVQLIFEDLFKLGFRVFCFVTGKGKRAIEDHFTPDYGFLNWLKGRGASTYSELERFYDMIGESSFIWVNQPSPRGFGDAVLRGGSVVAADWFMVQAGDTYVLGDGSSYRALMDVFHGRGADAALLVEELEDPRSKGVVKVKGGGGGVYEVLEALEKPAHPPSRLAIVPIYLFKRRILNLLEDLKPSVGGEVQLTDAISQLIDEGGSVYAVKLREGERALDVGDPATYWRALKDTSRSVGLSLGDDHS